MIKLAPIKPRAQIDFKKYADAGKLGLRDAADFEKTTATWEHDVEFGIKEQSTGFLVGPTGGATDIYGYVEHGTRAHQIVARRAKRLRFSPGGSAKTRPGFVGSTSGSAGSGVVFRRMVMHPGTKPRGFSKLIKAKWQVQALRLIERRIREA
jgi:hypothetical protein